MPDQLAIDYSAPYIPTSATSKAAAAAIEPNAGTLRAIVLEFLREMGAHGATDEELQSWLVINPSTERPRRIELVQRGLVVDSGRTRKTRAGRNATVWVAA